MRDPFRKVVCDPSHTWDNGPSFNGSFMYFGRYVEFHGQPIMFLHDPFDFARFKYIFVLFDKCVEFVMDLVGI